MAERKKPVMTPAFRVSFPEVFKPKGFGNNEPKFSVVALFPKGTDLSALKKKANEVAHEKWGEKVPKLRSPFRDGNEDKPGIDGYKDVTFMTLSSKQKPGLVDQNVQPIISQDQFYAGCWARATINCYAYGGKGTEFAPGVAFGLGNLQKLRDDVPFSGRTDAEDDFEPVEGGSDNPASYSESDDVPF